MPITQTIRPRAWSRRLLRNGSRSIAGLLPRSGRGAFGVAELIPVEGEEDVLEVGFATRHGDDFVARQHLDDGVQRAAHGERRDVLDRHQLALTDEGHAVADALHLGENVRRQEHGLPRLSGLLDQVMELVLHQRVEADGGLIKDEQLRPVHERLDEAEFALVAGREVGDLLPRIEVEALAEHVYRAWIRAAAQVGEVAQRLVPGEPAVEAQLTGQVAAAPAYRHALAAAVEAEDERPAARRPDEVEQHADGRRLAGPVGTEKAEHAARLDLEVEIRHAAVLAVALRHPLQEDCAGHALSRSSRSLQRATSSRSPCS